jgi:hypothetical protein
MGKEKARLYLFFINTPVDLDPYRLLHFQT